MKKLEPLGWTSLLDEDLQILAQEPEWEGDRLLVILVKIQLAVDQISRVPWSSSLDGGPPAFYLDSLRARLQAIKDQVPAELVQHRERHMAGP